MQYLNIYSCKFSVQTSLSAFLYRSRQKTQGKYLFPVCVHIHRSIFFFTSVQLWKHADLVLSLHSRSVKSVQFTSDLLRIPINDTSGSPSLVPKYLLESCLLRLHPRLNSGCQSWGAVIRIFDKHLRYSDTGDPQTILRDKGTSLASPYWILRTDLRGINL